MLFGIIFGTIYAYLIWFVLIPYFRFDQFQFWDAAGHYFAVWFQRSHLFPAFSGWNPFFFCGYPQGTFYGSFYHYLTALVSFPLGLPLAFKVVSAFCIIILPLSIYYLARKLKFNPNESAVIVLLVMLPVAGLHLACGGTLFSLFGVGLNTNALGLPLYLFYFGKLKEEIDNLHKGQKISQMSWLILTLLAATIVLSHFVVAIAAAITALILVLNSFSKKVFLFSIKHAAIIFLLCSFFLLPLAAYSSQTENSGTILSMGFFLTIPFFLMILLGVFAGVLDKDERFDRTFFTLLAVFAVVLFLDFGQIGFPMHAYRFLIFFMLLAMMLPVKMIFNNIQDKLIKRGLAILFVLLLGWQLHIMIVNNPRMEINYNRLFTYKDYPFSSPSKVELGKLEGRIILLEQNNPIAPRALSHRLAQSTSNYFLSGLFAESSANSGYINWLQMKMVNLLSSGTAFQKKEEVNRQRLIVSKLFKLFQVNYILSELPIKNLMQIKKVKVLNDRPPFLLYKIGSEKIAELLSYVPYFTVNNWKAATYSWFESPDPRILVRAADLPRVSSSINDKLTISEEGNFPPRLKLKVEAEQDVPILIKISYFPRWQARAGGKSLKIYQVAPSFMLIYGKGEITIEYQSTLIDKLGILLTFIGIGWLLFEIFLAKKSTKKI
ncbi:MAG: hypothetical protein FD145_1579 [Candidatus Saganbacteria bacterium]|uniref:Membrane protein 6-pyruvoyl-tetrahydropterin synthase-related domain-containing protein n=1 Tax=Candidatus Saganbacteria bacterium TaxID=2575572 RepID=A0A833KZI3_UNCSA|nr:MAG: hypothetical protein FD145_1579 [Candidatus Saganbacteria bacterium]